MVMVVPVHFTSNRIGNWYGLLASKVVQKLGAVAVTVDAKSHVAWFHTTVEASYDLTVCADPQCMSDKPSHVVKANKAWRLEGVAVDDKGWKLSALMWAEVVPDKELMKHVVADAPTADPSMSGDAWVAKTVLAWFPGKLATAAQKGAIVQASGTSPSENASGAAAVKLAATWDSLKLFVTKADVTLFADGAIGFVHVDLWIPSAKPKGAVKTELGAIVVPDGREWKWVALSFKADDNPQQ